MTFPLKETLKFFEELGRRQTQIYSDAADYGFKIKSPGQKKLFRSKLKELMNFYGYKVQYWGDHINRRAAWGSETDVFMPIENDFDLEEYKKTGRATPNGMWGGLRLTVTYNYDDIRKIEFVTIEICNEILYPHDAKAKYGCKILGEKK